MVFVRNIIEYIESNNCSDYFKLKSCSHKKDDTIILLVKDIFDILETEKKSY